MFNKKNTVAAMLPNLSAVAVRFDGGANTYTYLSPFHVEEGDVVVVHTPSRGLKLVKVEAVSKVIDFSVAFKYKYLVAKVDLAGYDSFMSGVERLEDAIHRAHQESLQANLRKMLVGGLSGEALEAYKALTGDHDA